MVRIETGLSLKANPFAERCACWFLSLRNLADPYLLALLINVFCLKGNQQISGVACFRGKWALSGEYNKLLERAYSNLPKAVGTGERFEIPRIVGIRMGRRTIIQNFGEVSSKLNRDPRHLLKFLSGEMATAASLDGARAIFQGRFDVETVTRLLTIYAQRYVVCPICNRPDTKMEKEGRYLFLRCEACGARSSILQT
jgi:translation initiation factor 2 subunit 2